MFKKIDCGGKSYPIYTLWFGRKFCSHEANRIRQGKRESYFFSLILKIMQIDLISTDIN